MSVASAFYKGDKNRPMLQRIYGTCFPNRTQLDEHLARLEEARRRDHRKLGRELGLFCIDEAVGQGLILWKPKGALIRRSLQDFITEELDKLGYSQVYTPNIASWTCTVPPATSRTTGKASTPPSRSATPWKNSVRKAPPARNSSTA